MIAAGQRRTDRETQMKLQMIEDERFPYVFVSTVEEVRRRDVDRAETWRKKHGGEMPESFYEERREGIFRDVPDALGAELVALRKREEELLDEIEQHIRSTGQGVVQEDWEPST
jgi:hypothetical protein